MDSILGMEPIVAFLYLHIILFSVVILLAFLSYIKKLERSKILFSKTNYIILLIYVAFHVFCVCAIFLGVFVDSIPSIFWLVFYLKLCIALGFFLLFMMAIGLFLLPFGMLTIILNLIKNTLK